MSKATLQLANISKQYKQGTSIIKVLHNVNLTIMEGELIAIVGSSGSGKSTLLHIAGLLDQADSGEVRIMLANSSSSIKNRPDHLIRLHHIGFIYQQHHLLKDFTARENVALPKLIATGNYQVALDEADQLLTELNLAEKIHNMPGELSGGEQQRVAIARSLVNRPRIILADEPTGNLDPNTASEVLNLFLKIAQQQNISMIMITHNHEIACKMDKIYKLQYGILQEL